MTIKPRKLLLIGVTTLFMSSLATDVIVNYATTTTVSAAKHHKKKSTKKKAKKQKAKSKKSSNDKQTTKQSQTTQSNNNGIEPQSKYSSLADWYVANAQSVFNKYSAYGSQPNSDFIVGIDDGITEGSLTPSKYSNEMYKEGWIIQYVYGDGAPFSGNIYQNIPVKQAYANAIQIYDAAASVAKSPKYDRIYYYGTIANPDASAWRE